MFACARALGVHLRPSTVCVCVCVFAGSDDEHMLIQHYCQSLNQGSPLSQPRSPAQILISMETEEKGELERVLNDLEQENRSADSPAHLGSKELHLKDWTDAENYL